MNTKKHIDTWSTDGLEDLQRKFSEACDKDHAQEELEESRAARHPLESFVLAAIKKRGLTDATDVAYDLAGALMRPKRGRDAYRIVAADILERMNSDGRLTRQGSGDHKRPDHGGFVYIIPEANPFPAVKRKSLAALLAH